MSKIATSKITNPLYSARETSISYQTGTFICAVTGGVYQNVGNGFSITITKDGYYRVFCQFYGDMQYTSTPSIGLYSRLAVDGVELNGTPQAFYRNYPNAAGIPISLEAAPQYYATGQVITLQAYKTATDTVQVLYSAGVYEGFLQVELVSTVVPVSAAPVFACRAWVHFDGTAYANVSGTYVRTATTVVVTRAAHGNLAGHRVYCDFTSGTAVDGLFTITSVTPDTFTFTHGTSGDTSGNVTEVRNLILGSGNVSSVAEAGSADHRVNLTVDMPSTNMCLLSGQGPYNDTTLSPVQGPAMQMLSTNAIRVTTGSNTSTLAPWDEVNVAVFG